MRQKTTNNLYEDKKEDNIKDKYIDDDKEDNEFSENEDNSNKNSEEGKEEEEEEKQEDQINNIQEIVHKIKGPIFCALHNNRKFKNIEAYLNHCRSKHKLFKCQECRKVF